METFKESLRLGRLAVNKKLTFPELVLVILIVVGLVYGGPSLHAVFNTWNDTFILPAELTEGFFMVAVGVIGLVLLNRRKTGGK
jgi:hypothetical protein